MTAKNPRAIYACVNDGEAACPKDIDRQSVCINKDISSVLNSLLDNSADWIKQYDINPGIVRYQGKGE